MGLNIYYLTKVFRKLLIDEELTYCLRKDLNEYWNRNESY